MSVLAVCGATGCAREVSPSGDAGSEAPCSADAAAFTCTPWTVTLTCANPPAPDAALTSEDCARYCGNSGASSIPVSCYVVPRGAGEPARVACSPLCAVDGRRPEGFEDPAVDPDVDPVLGWLRASEALEFASITAFEHLARELRALGAPDDLAARSLAAADDERRHTAQKGSLARSLGPPAALPQLAAPALRGLPELARENAVEGCVRETWGALLAGWQAARAQSPAVAEVMASVAEDEGRHAQLAWDVHRWAMTRLAEDERRAVESALHGALDELAVMPLGADDVSLQRAAGMPSAREGARLFAGLRRAVLAEAPPFA